MNSDYLSGSRPAPAPLCDPSLRLCTIVFGIKSIHDRLTDKMGSAPRNFREMQALIEQLESYESGHAQLVADLSAAALIAQRSEQS